MEATCDQEETYAEEGEMEDDEEEDGLYSLRYLSTKFQSQPEVYFQEKLFSALFDKLLGKFLAVAYFLRRTVRDRVMYKMYRSFIIQYTWSISINVKLSV